MSVAVTVQWEAQAVREEQPRLKEQPLRRPRDPAGQDVFGELCTGCEAGRDAVSAGDAGMALIAEPGPCTWTSPEDNGSY